MEQRDINSRTRADTFGLRPDLYDALAGNMVKKDDLGAIGGLLGYGRINSTAGLPTDPGVPAGGTYLGNTYLSESTWGEGAELSAAGDGMKLIAGGVWVIMSRAEFRPEGTVGSRFNVGFRTVLPDGSYSDIDTTHWVGNYQAKIGHTSLVVAEEAGVVIRPLLVCGTDRGTQSPPRMILTAYRIDGGA